MNNSLFLSNSSSTPMYTQIMEQIVAKIMASDWRPGQAIPSIRELASASGVSVITVKRAYLELERAGAIVTRQGIGSFVAENHDWQRQLTEETFNNHLLGMLDAGYKLGLHDTEIVAQVKVAQAARAVEVVPVKATAYKK